MSKKKIQISFTDEQIKKLKERKKQNGESIATLVRLSVDYYFNNNPGAK